MRRDIKINTHTHDMVMQDSSKGPAYPFVFIGENDLCLLGKIVVPYYFDANIAKNDGIKIAIPYTPIYKYLQVTITYPSGNPVMMNRRNGTEWFDVYVDLYSEKKQQLHVSEFVLVNINSYQLQFDDETGECMLWSSNVSDVINADANPQNKDMLLQCNPTNNYRYPLSGVGFVKYVHSIPQQTDLAVVLDREFEADGTPVINADMDDATKEMLLNLDYSKLNEDEDL